MNIQLFHGLKAEKISSGMEHCFFGYYDIPAFSKDGKYHLCNKVNFYDKIPEKDDIMEIGIINISTKEYTKISETTAWNFQQGCMLQWRGPAFTNEVIYNICIDGEYYGVIHNIKTNERKILPAPAANVSSDGIKALSINFPRLFGFRPGYGYAGYEDKFSNQNIPENDGVYLMDLDTLENKLVINYKQLWDIVGKAFDYNKDTKLVINHITFNTDATRIVFLVRYFPNTGHMRNTTVLTADIEGENIFKLIDFLYASHYHWKDAGSILFHSCYKGKKSLYEYLDRTDKVRAIGMGQFNHDGHCNYSPDRKWILYDSYPDSKWWSRLYLYNFTKNKKYEIARIKSEERIYKTSVDIRCDLHPRWSPDGKAISFDSLHEGRRDIYYIDLTKFIKNI